MGVFIQVDEGKARSVPNVFAYGDASRGMLCRNRRYIDTHKLRAKLAA